MKKIFVIVLAVVGSAFMPVLTDWKTVDIIEKVKISMPTEPVIVDAQGGPQLIKKSVMADSTELGLIVLDFTKLGVPQEELDALKDTEEFKEQIKMGITQRGGEVKAEAEGKYKDKHTYYQFDLEISKNGRKFHNTTRMVFYKQYALTLTYQSGGSGEKKEIKDQYFNSLVIAE